MPVVYRSIHRLKHGNWETFTQRYHTKGIPNPASNTHDAVQWYNAVVHHIRTTHEDAPISWFHPYHVYRQSHEYPHIKIEQAHEEDPERARAMRENAIRLYRHPAITHAANALEEHLQQSYHLDYSRYQLPDGQLALLAAMTAVARPTSYTITRHMLEAMSLASSDRDKSLLDLMVLTATVTRPEEHIQIPWLAAGTEFYLRPYLALKWRNAGGDTETFDTILDRITQTMTPFVKTGITQETVTQHAMRLVVGNPITGYQVLAATNPTLMQEYTTGILFCTEWITTSLALQHVSDVSKAILRMTPDEQEQAIQSFYRVVGDPPYNALNRPELLSRFRYHYDRLSDANERALVKRLLKYPLP